MMMIPALVIPLLREIEALLARRPAPAELPAEFASERTRDAGLQLSSRHLPVQGSPIYLPAEYR